MKLKSLLLSTVALATLIFSCSDESENMYKETNLVTFKSTITNQTTQNKTRAAGTAWNPDDAIGIFMKTGTGLTSIVGDADNKKYQTTGDGNFTAATSNDAVYFPNGVSVDFIAYYPYTNPLNNYIYKVNIADQSSQEDIDLLYSDNATGKTGADDVTLNFKHMLSKVVFNITASDPVTSLAELKVEISNLKTAADYNLSDKSLVEEGSASTVELKTTVNGLNAVSEAIILPTTAAARKFIFTLKIGDETKSFEWDASSQNFAQGKKNTYPVQLSEIDGVTLNPDTEIEDWGEGSSEGITIDLTPSTGDGTQGKPFNIAAVASQVGETAQWVEGYIIGSKVVTRVIGAESTNILLADASDETDETNCIVVNIVGSAVQANLNVVTNPTLIGKKVKIQGDIVDNLFGGVLSMTNIITQVGGAEVSAEPVEFFSETFGAPDDKTGSKNFAIASYSNYDMSTAIYSSLGTVLPNLNANYNGLGNLGDYDYNVQFPKDSGEGYTEKVFVIENIESDNYDNLKLSFDIAGSNVNVRLNDLTLKCDDVEVPLSDDKLSGKDTFQTVNVNIPDGTTKLEFIRALKAVAYDYTVRLDNIKITGTQVIP